MRYANTVELRRDTEAQEKERRTLAGKVRRLKAENKRLRKALEPMTRGTYWINAADVARAKRALGLTPNDQLQGAARSAVGPGSDS